MKITVINGNLDEELYKFGLYYIGDYRVIERLFTLCKRETDKVYFVANENSFYEYKDIIKKYNVDVIFSNGENVAKDIKGFYEELDIVYFVDCTTFVEGKIFCYGDNADFCDENNEIYAIVRTGSKLISQGLKSVVKVLKCKGIVINSSKKYAEAIKKFYLSNALNLIDIGVNIIDVNNTYIGDDVVVYPGVVIYPSTQINGHTVINERTIIYSNCCIEDAIVGSDCLIGPFSNLKKGTHVGKKCIVGAFVELKNTVLKNNVKVKHHAYLGDGIVENNCNIGCGVIFANYDGKEKHKTLVGKNCFIGSNVTIVAPCNIGDNSFVAAGSTIVKEVEKYSLAIARSRQVNKIDYYK